MDLLTTCFLLGACASLTALAGWRDARPATHKPRLIPWRTLLVVSGAASVFLIVRLLDLAGLPLPRGRGLP